MKSPLVHESPGQAVESPILTIIIVNYESWPDVTRLLATLLVEPVFRSGRLEIVVVDNASQAPIPERLSLSPPPDCGSWPGPIMADSLWASTRAGGSLEAPGCSS